MHTNAASCKRKKDMAQVISNKFNFKTRTIKDENGVELGKAKKQDSVVAQLSVPDTNDVIELLGQGGAVSVLILSAVKDLIVGAARDQFDEIIESFGLDDSKSVSADMLDHSKLTLEYIASIPASSRGGATVTDDDWVSFFADYKAVMIAATGKEEKKIDAHINYFKKPQLIRNNKPVLSLLIDQLDLYAASTANLDDNAAAYERTKGRFTKYLNEPEKIADVSAL